jgi:hypothetical protein
MKKYYSFDGIIFDDARKGYHNIYSDLYSDKDHSQICYDCIVKYNITNNQSDQGCLLRFDSKSDFMNICGIKGCSNQAKFDIYFGRKALIEIK